MAADIHGTLVNNLTYQLAPFGPQIATSAFEISTGAVAFDAPFGPTVVDLAAGLGLLGTADKLLYDALPPAGKDQFVKQLVNTSIAPFGYDPVGLNDNLPAADGLIDAQLTVGDYVALHTYGWTQFEVDPQSQQLTVTTWGVTPYSESDLALDPAAIVEAGAWQRANLRQSPKMLFFPWTAVSDLPEEPKQQPKSTRSEVFKASQGIEAARRYQARLDDGTVRTRAALARFVGVGRARVTQVLKRLDAGSDDDGDDQR